MGSSPKVRLHRRALCLAVGALLPASLAAGYAQSATGADVVARKPSAAVIPAPTGVMPAVSSQPSTVHLSARQTARTRHSRMVAALSGAPRLRQVSANTSYDVPLVALQAYRNAASVLRRSAPSCHLDWSLLAAIGQVESDHGRVGGATVLADGTSSPSIVGPVLNGRGPVQRISDTDNGRLDGDPVWDRAVGPMQFLPSTWAVVGVDGDQDGVRNPNDINDAALAAGSYLCAGGGDLRTSAGARQAVYSYNHSKDYVNLVMTLAAAYSSGAADVVGLNVSNPLVGGLPPVPAPSAMRPASRSDAAVRAMRAHARRMRAQVERAARARADGTGPGTASRHRQHDQGGSTLIAGQVVRSPKPGSSHPAAQSPSPIAPAPSQSPSPAPAPTSLTPTPTPSPTPTPTPTPSPTPTPTPSPTPSPTPTPTPTPSPTPTPTPTPTPSPTPSPATSPTPDTTLIAGTLTSCDDVWCIDDVPLVLGHRPDLSVVQGDYDGDGTAESVADELTGLVDSRVRVLTDADGLVLQINRIDYVPTELPPEHVPH